MHPNAPSFDIETADSPKGHVEFWGDGRSYPVKLLRAYFIKRGDAKAQRFKAKQPR